MSARMTIRDLIQGLPPEVVAHLSESELAMPVRGVTADSRKIQPGFVFVAVRGGQQDGHAFLAQAQQQGAVFLVGETGKPGDLLAPYLQVRDSRLTLARLAANFSGNPSHQMKMVGVTGTSGKTTTTYLIEAILKAAGHRVGVIGTVEVRYGIRRISATHTTPGPVELQALLAEMLDQGCTAVVMEVSSHALKQHRSAFIAFDAMVFSNLSPEHLDFHRDMEDYFHSKATLFREYIDHSVGIGKHPVAVVNSDDLHGQRILVELRPRLVADGLLAPILRGFSYGLEPGADLCGSELQISLAGVKGEVAGVKVDSPLPGRFNAQNVLAALGVGIGLRLEPEVIAEGLRELRAVPGRLEKVENRRKIHILVDYAHKPDALQKVLEELRANKGAGQLITVFGCGGDRDRKKRPMMGKIALEYSDLIWVTSDNPRTEDPKEIIREILSGMTAPGASSSVRVQPDRRQAIFEAINVAEAGDVVLIAGKGHETYQILKDAQDPSMTVQIEFDDRKVAQEALKARKPRKAAPRSSTH